MDGNIIMCAKYAGGILTYSRFGGFCDASENLHVSNNSVICKCDSTMTDDELPSQMRKRTIHLDRVLTFLGIDTAAGTYTTTKSSKYNATCALEANMELALGTRTSEQFSRVFVNDVTPGLLEKISGDVKNYIDALAPRNEYDILTKDLRELSKFIIDLEKYPHYIQYPQETVNLVHATERAVYSHYVLPHFNVLRRTNIDAFLKSGAILELASKFTDGMHIFDLLEILKTFRRTDIADAISSIITDEQLLDAALTTISMLDCESQSSGPIAIGPAP